MFQYSSWLWPSSRPNQILLILMDYCTWQFLVSLKEKGKPIWKQHAWEHEFKFNVWKHDKHSPMRLQPGCYLCKQRNELCLTVTLQCITWLSSQDASINRCWTMLTGWLIGITSRDASMNSCLTMFPGSKYKPKPWRLLDELHGDAGTLWQGDDWARVSRSWKVQVSFLQK